MENKMKFTAQQESVINFLKGNKEWISPTTIGNALSNRGSAWASPKCLRLVEMGVLKRNDRGHYMLTKPGKTTKKKPTTKKINYRGLCQKCVHRRGIPGDAHIRCNNTKAQVKGDRIGIQGGWFLWPINFDPTWLEFCDGFSDDPKKNMKENKPNPVWALLSMLGIKR